MTQEQIQALLQSVARYADMAANAGEQFLPAQFAVPIVIGKAIIDLVPGIEGDVYNMIKGTPQTPAQQAATASKLAVLGSADGL